MNESWQEVAEEKHSETAHGNNLPKTFQFVKSDNKYKKREKLADKFPHTCTCIHIPFANPLKT